MAFRVGDRVVAVRDFGGIIREAIPAGATGRVVDAPLLGPAQVEFDRYDFWHGRRTVTMDVDTGDVAALRQPSAGAAIARPI
jgi:hypothetical protein